MSWNYISVSVTAWWDEFESTPLVEPPVTWNRHMTCIRSESSHSWPWQWWRWFWPAVAYINWLQQAWGMMHPNSIQRWAKLPPNTAGSVPFLLLCSGRPAIYQTVTTTTTTSRQSI